MRQRLRALLARGGDSLLAIVLVVVFFAAFLVILVFSFPRGSGMSTLFQPGTPLEETAPAIPVTGPARWEAVLARLETVTRTVKNRKAGSIVWHSASAGLNLADQDAVQTFRGSGATIQFVRKQEISLAENSLVVIRRFEKEAASGTNRATIVLLGGSIDGAFASSPDGPASVEVVAGNAAATIASPKSGTTRFRVEADPADNAAVSVSTGEAVVRVGDRTVTVGAGQVVSVSAAGRIEGPSALPKAPVLVTPENGAVLTARVSPLEVSFEWKEDRADRSYRIEIARDPSFEDRIVDERVKGHSFIHPGFQLGTHYWRVRSVLGAMEGRLSKPRSFEIANDSEPPALRVEFPQEPVEHGEVLVRGTTEPGARVYVGKKPAVVGADGSFEGRVALSRGVQILVVEAIDTAGNVAYESRTLAAR